MGGIDLNAYTAGGGGSTLSSGVSNSAVTYAIADCDRIAFQLNAGSWPGGCVVTVEISNDGTNYFGFPDSAVTYSAIGVFQTLNIELWKWIRLRVSTTGGSTTITPIARGSVL